ncbi:MAG: hypothetical protein ACT4O2_05630 [Beijerinckiaceae bacterium]
MTLTFKVQLLYGLLERGQRHTVAELRDPAGYDEAMLAELGRDTTPVERVSALLAALTLRLGEIEAPAADRLLDLTAGDRERLVLALCARLLGSEIDLVAACPSCGALAEIPVCFAEVAAARPAAGASMESYFALQAGGANWVARLRLPTGADLERTARGGPGAARDLILCCIEELADPSGGRVARSKLPAACESSLAEALLALDPIAEWRFAGNCPSCAEPIDMLLDGYTILQSGLGSANRVYREVFRMARNYHWCEAEILALPLRRRRRYLAIAEAAEIPP